MELTNDFRVGVDRATVWGALTDLERIAPLLPGAQLQEVEGAEYRGIVKIKVGPIKAQYQGTATLIETDEAAGRMVMKASGRDTRGQGNASATITVTIAGDADGTQVNALTDLTISGKVAQFGRGVLADVSTNLIGQFADNLEHDLAASPGRVPDDVPDSSAGEALTGLTDDHPATETPAVGVADPRQAAAHRDFGPVGPGTTAPAPTAPASASQPVAPPPAAPANGPRKIVSAEPEAVNLLGAAGNPIVKRLVPVGIGVALTAIALLAARRRRNGTG